MLKKNFLKIRIHLNDKKIGIYTLNENAAKRIREIIVSKVPSCKIDLNSDKECTTRLKAIASNSDILFSLKYSKHQAFLLYTEQQIKGVTSFATFETE